MAAWPCPLMRKAIGDSQLQPTLLYSCRLRTALHVHTGQLLRNTFAECRQGLSSVENQHADGASEIDFHDKRSLSCADAIGRGLRHMKDGKYENAIMAFTMALSVSPESEFTRSGSLGQVCESPSEQEEEAALYHLACCYSKLGELDSGLAVLRGLLELPSFNNFDILRHTPDMQELRSTWGFVSLLQEFDQGAVIQEGADSGSSMDGSKEENGVEAVSS